MKKIIILAALIPCLWIAHRTEIDIGRVVNNQGDGKLYNGESFYNYIHYPAKYHENDIILTVDIMNPLNNYCDDTIFRYDIRLFENV